MGSVFDDPQIVRRTELAQLIEIDHHAAHVDRNDPDDIDDAQTGNLAAPGLCQFSLGVSEIDVQRHRVAVDEDRHGIHVADDFCRRSKRHRGHEDRASLGPVAEAERFDRQVQGGRRGVHRDRIARADRCSERLLELPDARTGRQPARPEDRKDLGFFLGPNLGTKKWNVQRRLSTRIPNVDRYRVRLYVSRAAAV
jgi:hypothetical protein